MNLEEIKKLSEIFNNIAQPITTIIVGVLSLKINTKQNSKKRKRK